MENHEILGGKVQLYRRANSKFWWCATRLGGKQRRVTTKKESLKLAEDFATDWYLTLQGKVRTGELEVEKLFDEVGDWSAFTALARGIESRRADLVADCDAVTVGEGGSDDNGGPRAGRVGETAIHGRHAR